MKQKTLLGIFLILFLFGNVYANHEFGKPGYDSGWTTIAQSATETFNFTAFAASVDDMVVDLQFRDGTAYYGVNQRHYGYFYSSGGNSLGTFWSKLTTTSIDVYRLPNDTYADEVRVRIWDIPTANYDSGWTAISQDEKKTFTHNIGGNTDEYLVYMEFNDSPGMWGIHHSNYGGEQNPINGNYYGAYWRNLTDSSIQVYRHVNDGRTDEVRVRIWKLRGTPAYDSGWTNITQGSAETFDHNLGGPWNDYIVDMQFMDLHEIVPTDYHGVNQAFYGGAYRQTTLFSGAYWRTLNANSITVYRFAGDIYVDKVRVRIWKCSEPQYDSGWDALSANGIKTLTHNLGGNTDDYVTDLQFKDGAFGGGIGVHTLYYGGDQQTASGGGSTDDYGVYWYNLTDSIVRFYRRTEDTRADYIRYRIWIPPTADYDSGWTTINNSTSHATPDNEVTFTHNLGGTDPDDYVVYLEFRNAGTDVHQRWYGGMQNYNDTTTTYTYTGANWYDLDTTSIKVVRWVDDTTADEVRVRIWKNSNADWSSGETTLTASANTDIAHTVGGDSDDYVVDLHGTTDGGWGLSADHHSCFGITRWYDGTWRLQGVFWQELSPSNITVFRGDPYTGLFTFHEKVKLRVWDTNCTNQTGFVWGRVMLGGLGLAGVTMTFDNSGGTCSTDSNGYYYMSLPYNYSGTATPSASGYTFAAASTTYSNVTSDTETNYTGALVPTISVTSPTGASNWNTGTAYNITWTTTGTVGDVKIELLKGGSLDSTIESSTSNDGTHSWTPLHTLNTGSDYAVKISDAASSSVTDTSAQFTITCANPATISLNRTQLNFGSTGSSNTTSQEWFRISNSGGGTLSWTATPSESWMSANPSSGTDSGLVNITVSPSGLSTGTHSGTVSIAASGATNSPQTVNVTFVVKASASDENPFGSFDTPIHGSTVMSSIPVTGWALDDVEVTGVKLYRDPISGEGSSRIYIGDTVFIEGARTDVETHVTYSTYPFHFRAGWGYMMLTNFLPNQGNGTFVIYAYVTDSAGHEVSLGSKTITCTNSSAVKPFGAIDTPTQGGTTSGTTYYNFGWVLTPLPNTIPTDGSTIDVYIDGVNIAHPVYNNYRVDIATLFPGYNNSSGAVGVYTLDTTCYSDGVHTIQWYAEDDALNGDGIGSRYFTIDNSASPAPKNVIVDADNGMGGFYWYEELEMIPDDQTLSLRFKRGYRKDAIVKNLYPDEAGFNRINIREDERIEINVAYSKSEMSLHSGCIVAGKRLRPLPIGSTLDKENGKFLWQPGPGFLGEFKFVFLLQDAHGLLYKKSVIVNIKPKFDLKKDKENVKTIKEKIRKEY